MAMVFFSLGTNLGDKLNNLKFALKEIKRKIGEIIKISSIYESEPWGYISNNYFYNVCVSVNTSLNCFSILNVIKEIEKFLGRNDKSLFGYADRTIDIDILFYDSLIIKTNELIIPHDKLHERNFVLYPLNEISPNFVHPVFKKSIKNLLLSCNDRSYIRKINEQIIY